MSRQDTLFVVGVMVAMLAAFLVVVGVVWIVQERRERRYVRRFFQERHR